MEGLSGRFARNGAQPTPRLGWVLVLLLVSSLLVSVGTTEASPEPVASGSRVLWGFRTPSGPWNLDELVALEGLVGKGSSLHMWAQDFTHSPDFDPRLADGVWTQGAWPILTWSPWNHDGGPRQAEYSLASIIQGRHDAHIRRWARQIASWGKPLMLRFAHEMNGDWFPWSVNANGNRREEFVPAWRHVHRLFAEAGATNVRWIWSVNVLYGPGSELSGLFPGDGYVDYVAVDGYNPGSDESKGWRSFEDIFGTTLRAVRALSSKPVLLTEVASGETGGDKAAWIRDFFAHLRNHPEIVGFVWVNRRLSADWRVESSVSAQEAFIDGISDDRYSDAVARGQVTRPPRPFLGVATAHAPWQLGELGAFEAAVGRSVDLVMWYQDFAHFPNFDPALANSVLDRGAEAMLTWDPWDHTGGVDQPRYRLARIIAGDHDEHIRRWARQIAAWNRPLYLRFAHEMNGKWNSWSEGVNGNQAGEFVRAWRRVHDLFRNAGATNVKWVWSPNVVYSNSPPLGPYYPGDSYVDVVGMDGYNWGNHFSFWKAWLSFEELFGPTIAQVRVLTGKPLMIAETASTELGGDKAAWIRDFFASLRRHPEIVGIVWFNQIKETDWRITSSTAARAAFAEGAAAM